MFGKTLEDKMFHSCNLLFMLLVCGLTMYPFFNTLAISLNDGLDANRGGIYLWPRSFSLASYETVFSDQTIVRAYLITISRTVLGILITVLCTGILAYGLSKKNLIGRNVYLFICVVALIFNGGLIPTYLLYRDLGLINNFLVYILPGAVNVWYMILMKSFFEQLPVELEESAKMDGCGFLQTFFRITLPLSKPIIATICIFVGVDHWNNWFDAYVFVNNEKLQPIQTYLYKVIALAQTAAIDPVQQQMVDRLSASPTTIKAATVIITMIPIATIYFFFQKHFTKGIMLGAIKG